MIFHPTRTYGARFASSTLGEKRDFKWLVDVLARNGNLNEASWTKLGGDRLVQAGLKARVTDSDFVDRMKSIVLLASAILRSIPSTRAGAFIEYSKVRQVLATHEVSIRDFILAEHIGTWAVRPLKVPSYEVAKRKAYEFAPFWLMDIIEPSLLSSWRLKSIIVQQKVYRDFVRYVGRSEQIKLDDIRSINKTVTHILGLKPAGVRNMNVRLPLSFSAWFQFYLEFATRLGVFTLDLPGHATLRISRDDNMTGKRVLECTGRIFGWMVASGHRVKGIYFQESLYAYLMGKPLTREMLKRDFPDAARKVKETVAADLTSQRLMYVVNEDGVDIPLPGAPESLLVDETNKEQYIQAYIDYHLKPSGVDLIRKGFQDVMPLTFLKGWSPADLKRAISKSAEIMVEELKAHVKTDLTDLTWFWKEISSWSQSRLMRLLVRWTGSYEVPPRGLKNIRGGYEIRRSDKMSADPTTKTLFVPKYPTEQELIKALSNLINV